jgi:hypothetical protein
LKSEVEDIVKKEKAKQTIEENSEEASGDKKAKKDKKKKDKKKKEKTLEDGQEDRSFKIADIVFSYDNSQLIKLLQERGTNMSSQ